MRSALTRQAQPAHGEVSTRRRRRRLLALEGDGRAAHGGNSAGIDAATEACLVDLLLPDAGVVRQEVLFQAPAGTGAQLTATTAVGALAGASR